MKPTHTLREEHDLLMRKIQEFEEVLDVLPRLPREDLERVVAREVGFLQKEIKNHAAAEEKYLYTEVDYLCGHCRDAGLKTTATMEIDHEYIAAYIDRLSEMASSVRSETLPEFQRAGWELVAILKLHFDKEERVYLPLLDSRFTEEEIERRIVRRMEQYEKGSSAALPSEGELIAFG
ncbi:MAG TPA: hemerythrin domain-containing protein [candidate division Zixibacteria bacterium]|nr:hemerythrin domain-containing protein [candidate division Zixibacteria bacterium]